MQFDGTMDIPLPAAQTWQKLTDVNFLVTCLPDVEKVKEVQEDHAVCVLRPGFSFIRGTMELTIQRQEMEPEKSVTYLMTSKSVGSSSEVESRLTLEPSGETTRVPWQAEVKNMGGLLKAAPKGLIRGAAQKVITSVWDNVMAKLQKE